MQLLTLGVHLVSTYRFLSAKVETAVDSLCVLHGRHLAAHHAQRGLEARLVHFEVGHERLYLLEQDERQC